MVAAYSFMVPAVQKIQIVIFLIIYYLVQQPQPIQYIKIAHSPKQQYKYIGTFTISHYCIEQYPHICNAGYPYITANGTKPIPGKTIAADLGILPINTVIKVGNKEYTVTDTGSAIVGAKLDIVTETHKEALQKGVIKSKVWIAIY